MLKYKDEVKYMVTLCLNNRNAISLYFKGFKGNEIGKALFFFQSHSSGCPHDFSARALEPVRDPLRQSIKQHSHGTGHVRTEAF